MAVVSLLLSACAVKLAPDYDQAVITRLSAVNDKMSGYFVSYDPTVAFDARKAFYDETAGQTTALVTVLKARPMPQPAAFSWLTGNGADNAVADIVRNSQAPSIGALEKLSARVIYLRDQDKAGKLNQAKVDLTRGEMEAFMIDALTYEMALKR